MSGWNARTGRAPRTPACRARRCRVARRTCAAAIRTPSPACSARKELEQRALSDPGLPFDEDDVARTSARLPQQLREPSELGLASHEHRHLSAGARAIMRRRGPGADRRDQSETASMHGLDVSWPTCIVAEDASQPSNRLAQAPCRSPPRPATPPAGSRLWLRMLTRALDQTDEQRPDLRHQVDGLALPPQLLRGSIDRNSPIHIGISSIACPIRGAGLHADEAVNLQLLEVKEK